MKTTVDTIINDSINICQPAEGFRYSSDAVFLAWFVRGNGLRRIIDIGSGSGVISVILSSVRNYERIDAVEMQEEMFYCLTNSVCDSGAEGRVFPMMEDIRTYRPDFHYDAAVCNPPYRPVNAGHLPANETELNARFTATMQADDVFAFCRSFLKNKASLFLSYDADMMPFLFESAFKYGFEAKRLKPVCPDINMKPKIILMEFRKGGGRELCFEEPLYQKINGETSPQVKKILAGEWD